jgi:hypothetical protein
MRRYDDPVEVRRGMVTGPGGAQEGPEQFLWRGRLWKVHDVVAHWVETGAWWRSAGARAVLGADPAEDAGGTAVAVQAPLYGELSAEREVWRVEADRGLAAARTGTGRGVFDLTFDWADGSWRLTRCAD